MENQPSSEEASASAYSSEQIIEYISGAIVNMEDSESMPPLSVVGGDVMDEIEALDSASSLDGAGAHAGMKIHSENIDEHVNRANLNPVYTQKTEKKSATVAASRKTSSRNERGKKAKKNKKKARIRSGKKAKTRAKSRNSKIVSRVYGR